MEQKKKTLPASLEAVNLQCSFTSVACAGARGLSLIKDSKDQVLAGCSGKPAARTVLFCFLVNLGILWKISHFGSRFVTDHHPQYVRF